LLRELDWLGGSEFQILDETFGRRFGLIHLSLECENLIRANQDLVFRTLARMLPGRERLDDLAQEVFLRFWRAYSGFRGEANVSTYLYRIAVNVAKDEWARRRREGQTYSLADPQTAWENRLPDPSERADAREQKNELWRAVQNALLELPDAERTAIVLYHQEELSYEEISTILRLPIGTVRTHLHRGRARLRKLLTGRNYAATDL
jgi:RNA polymerase sigma factor (sigma-70 family)